MNIILASKSPRRQELLSKVVKEFQIIESKFDENSIEYDGNPETYVKELSKCKALEVAKQVVEPTIIIAADTIVFHKGKVLGKPKDKKDAFNMLTSLSGDTHEVYSGVCIVNTTNNDINNDVCVTEVKFSKLTNDQINNYIESGEPSDKAGAYGIQGLGGVFVEEIKGCYYSVMGLPINKVNKALLDYNITLL